MGGSYTIKVTLTAGQSQTHGHSKWFQEAIGWLTYVPTGSTQHECVCGGVTSSGDPGSRENEQHSVCVWKRGGGWGGRAGGWDGVGRQGKKTIEGGTSRLQGHLSPAPHPSSLSQLSSCPRGSDRTCPLLRLSLNTLSHGERNSAAGR